MSLKLFRCVGGEIVVPNKDLVLITRSDGGNLVVNPPREVWERSELNAVELANWSFLVAATGKAMLESLPQLEHGCINYWEAGNWALNEIADPVGLFKPARLFRKVHLHLLGRNPNSTNPDLKWGEAPEFPKFSDRFVWARNNERLTADECITIVQRAEEILRESYRLRQNQIDRWTICRLCGYPSAEVDCSDCSQH